MPMNDPAKAQLKPHRSEDHPRPHRTTFSSPGPPKRVGPPRMPWLAQPPVPSRNPGGPVFPGRSLEATVPTACPAIKEISPMPI